MLEFWQQEIVKTYIVPLIFISGSLILGFLFQKIIVQKLQKISVHTRWKGDDIFIAALSKIVSIWFFLAGLYAAFLEIPVDDKLRMLLYQILLILFILSLGYFLSRISGDVYKVYSSQLPGIFSSNSIFPVLTKILIFALSALIILQTLGISVTPLLTALGVGGIAIALALQDTLSNLFSGLYILATKEFRPGDFIQIHPGMEGFIQDISWRNTTIRTISNNLIIIPNSKIASETVINFSKPSKELSVVVEMVTGYESDLEKLEKIILEEAAAIMKKTEGGVPEYQPALYYQSFTEVSIHFIVILRAKKFTDQYLLKHEFMKAAHARLQKEKTGLLLSQDLLALQQEKILLEIKNLRPSP